jgi:PAS domain S-box-containing protein
VDRKLDLTDDSEEELRRGTWYLAQAQRLAHVGYWDRDLDAGRLTLSDESCHIFGLPPQRHVDLAQWHERWLQLVHPEDRPKIAEAAAAALRGGPPYDVEYRVVRPGGDVRIVRSRAEVTWDESGRPRRMFGVMQDVTNLRFADREFRRSQSYLAEAQRLSHTGSFGWNVSTGEITWSAETYRIFELAPSTAPTIALVLERTHPDDRSAVETAIRRAGQDGSDFDVEHRLVMPDGSVKHLHVVARAMTDEADRREFAGAVMDVTARKRAEEDLRASESRFRTLLDFAADTFMLHDDTGATVDVNRQACENLGYAREELIGLALVDFDADFDAARLSRLKERLDAGETATFETRHRRKDGTVFPVEVRARRVLYGDGWFAISLARDITERKRAEEERERLRRAEADLARISRATTMGEFTASLAHEIKQPVAAAITNAKTCIRWLARDRPDLGEARAAAARIVADATRVADIVNRVRSLYKNDAPRHERVDVNDVVRETLALLRSEASRHSVSIHADLAPDLPAAMGDRVQLQQVLVNLILNGLEATGAAPGVLRIESRRGGEGDLLVTVSDEGVGLPEGAADRIFDAFFTTKPQGTGMGLAISRSIVQRHGGRLWATPAEPRGTSFHVSLPAADPTG